MLNKKLYGFSFVEVIIAILIASVGLLLMGGILSPLHHQFTSNKGMKVRMQLEKMTATLESDSMKFRWDDTISGFPKIYSDTQKSTYRMLQKKKALILQNEEGQGYMPLLMGNDGFKWKYSEPIFEIWINYEKHVYHKKNVIPKRD